ncbi:hypothetical protein SNEBB_005267 [Seison nebaliae]|nr:hypothetical protein SNEBB_005267 [Seison nebaliae]
MNYQIPIYYYANDKWTKNRLDRLAADIRSILTRHQWICLRDDLIRYLNGTDNYSSLLKSIDRQLSDVHNGELIRNRLLSYLSMNILQKPMSELQRPSDSMSQRQSDNNLTVVPREGDVIFQKTAQNIKNVSSILLKRFRLHIGIGGGNL